MSLFSKFSHNKSTNNNFNNFSNNGFYIPATSVSALCDRHPYRSVADATLATLKSQKGSDLWPKLVKVYTEEIEYQQRLKASFGDKYTTDLTFKEAYLKTPPDLLVTTEPVNSIGPVQTKKDYVQALYQSLSSKSDATANLVAATTLTPANLNAVKDEVQQKLANEPAEIQTQVVQAAIMDRGTKMELSALETLKQDGVPLIIDTAHRSKKLTTDQGHPYLVGGRIDAFLASPDNDEEKVGVLEVKTRKNKIFGREFMPIYDLDQLTTYYLLTDLNFYAIVEYFEGRVEMTPYDKKFLADRWSQLRALLDNWVDQMDGLKQMIARYLKLTVNDELYEEERSSIKGMVEAMKGFVM